MSTKQKLLKVLAIVVAALQIPLLMLWKITLDAFKRNSSEIKYTTDGGFDLVFQGDKVASALVSFGPILLTLMACLVLSVLGLICILRKKQATVPAVCFYALTALSCGFLCLAFAAPIIIVGEANAQMLMLSEFMFYRYFAGMEWHAVGDIFPMLETIKFFFLGLLATGSEALFALGIVDLLGQRATPTPAEAEPCEVKEQPIEQNCT